MAAKKKADAAVENTAEVTQETTEQVQDTVEQVAADNATFQIFLNTVMFLIAT